MQVHGTGLPCPMSQDGKEWAVVRTMHSGAVPQQQCMLYTVFGMATSMSGGPPAGPAPRYRITTQSLPPPPNPAQPSATAAAALLESWQWTAYHTEQQVKGFLQALATVYPSTCSLQLVGRREILALEATSHADEPEDSGQRSLMADQPLFPKPIMTYIGNMHGDEDINREVLLQLCLELCSLGGGGSAPATLSSDVDAQQLRPRLQALLANTRLHVIPSMNPDMGYATVPKRVNANGVDLNRNMWTQDFNYVAPSSNTSGAARSSAAVDWLAYGSQALQPEARAVQEWMRRYPPRLSANLHGGALVASYAQDACDTLGAAWYPALGSMQDWAYWSLGAQQVTLELHAAKTLTGQTPAAIARQLPTFYPDNRLALLRFAEMSHVGFRALLLDPSRANATLAANVTITLPGGSQALLFSSIQDGLLSVLLIPGLSHSVLVQPYLPCDPDRKYAPIVLELKTPLGWDAAIAGDGLEGLGVTPPPCQRRHTTLRCPVTPAAAAGGGGPTALGPGGGGGGVVGTQGLGGSGGSSPPPHPMQPWTYLLAVLLAVGGVAGFAKAGSTKSLGGGLSAAIIAALSARSMGGASAMGGVRVAFVISLLLAAFFLSRYARTRKIMPA
ncbi:hypothetical protein QJQ45_019542, partial [Haematococcus lacustris]